MAKRTRKKRKISPIKKTLRKRNLARNFIVLLSLIFILLLFAYFFLSKNNQAVNSSSNNNILQSKKLYTNDEIMEEIIQNLNPDSKNNILEKNLETEENKKEIFEQELKKAKEMVIIGDNVGEHIFDKLLIKTIKKHYNIKIYYFVRGKPIINDITKNEAVLLADCANIVDTGVQTPGYDLKESNAKAKEIFDRADIVLAKGMGNFESLYQIAERTIYFLFIVKCDVVGQMIGQDVKSMIFKRE